MTGGQSSADIGREEYETETQRFPGPGEGERHPLVKLTPKEHMDDIFMVKQFAKDVVNNIKSLATDADEVILDPALRKVADSIESILDTGVETYDKAKDLAKLIKRARGIQATVADPRPGGAGDWPPERPIPVIPKVTKTRTGGTRVEKPMEIK